MIRKNNLVLLKVEETGAPLPLGDSDTVEIGEDGLRNWGPG